jgi:hypothetical protein
VKMAVKEVRVAKRPVVNAINKNVLEHLLILQKKNMNDHLNGKTIKT